MAPTPGAVMNRRAVLLVLAAATTLRSRILIRWRMAALACIRVSTTSGMVGEASRSPATVSRDKARGDRRQGTAGRRVALARQVGCGGDPLDWGDGGHLLSLAPGVRRAEVGSGEAAEGPGD